MNLNKLFYMTILVCSFSFCKATESFYTSKNMDYFSMILQSNFTIEKDYPAFIDRNLSIYRGLPLSNRKYTERRRCITFQCFPPATDLATIARTFFSLYQADIIAINVDSKSCWKFTSLFLEPEKQEEYTE